MSAPIKTQCPQCQTAFKLPNAALNQAHAKARCGCCKHTFLVNDFLVVSAKPSNSAPSNSAELSKADLQNPNRISNKSSDDELLIHDDMDLAVAADHFTGYDSVDDMDAWLNQLESQSSATDDLNFSPNQPAQPNQQSAQNFSTANAIQNPTRSPINKTSFQPRNSSANCADHDDDLPLDPQNQYKPSAENAWLEELLSAQDTKDVKDTKDAPKLARSEDSELVQLLSDMGMKTEDSQRLEQERQAKIAARLKISNQPPPQSMATFLWSLGCLVLVLLLAAQYVIFNLDSLIKNPAFAARLQSLCAIAACSLPHADIDMIEISTPTLRASQVKPAANFSDIQATLINQSDEPQLLPNMKVSLYQNGALVGEFIARPEDYVLAHESQLGSHHQKPVMFTVAMSKSQLTQVNIAPFY